MDIEKFNDALGAVEDFYDADIFVYSAPIDDNGFSSLTGAVAAAKMRGPRPNCLMILTTNGGLANSAYQIARLLQNTYDEFVLYAPRYCKSAGTIIALGANKIVMDVFGELGPLDVQLLDKDEIGNRKSGLLTRAAFESLTQEAFDMFSRNMLGIKAASNGLISFRLAADISWRMTAELFSPIFAQINPDVIGSDHRDLSVATQYGDRLAKISKNPKPNTVHKLVTEYPSHDFIIDREEATTLFNNVDEPSAELYELVGLISDIAFRQASPGFVAGCMPLEPEDPGEDPQHERKQQSEAGEDASVARSRRGDRSGDQRSKGGEPAEGEKPTKSTARGRDER